MNSSLDIYGDEFSLVRNTDNAVVISRIFLSDTGVASTPVMASHGENAELARLLKAVLEQKRRGGVAFGKNGSTNCTCARDAYAAQILEK